MKNRMFAILIAMGLLAAGCLSAGDSDVRFDGRRALRDVETQLKLGPRTIGSEAHAKAVDWMVAGLKGAGWTVEIQEALNAGKKIRNVVAGRGSDGPWIILGAHYDSRFRADQDPDPQKRTLPVQGANDGASGVAVLMELARTIPKDLKKQITLVFFDAEDNGEIEGWDWILGSKAYAARLTGKPDAVVIVDMIGDADLNIYREGNSDSGLTDEIWRTAARLKIPQFIDEPKYQILDDHIPFLNRGFRAADIIDFDYPHWHTTADTLDKVSAASLQAVGDVLLAWLNGR